MFRYFVFASLLASPALANGYEIGQVVDWPLENIQKSIAGFPLNQEEGRPQTSVVLRRDNSGNMIAQFAETGFADDSVEGMRHTYTLEPQADGRVKLLDSIVEYRCYRGETPKKWQTGLCP